MIEEESRRPAHGHFNVSHHETAMRADVYLSGDEALNAWAFAHKVIRRIEDDEVFMAPIEPVILSTLRYYKWASQIAICGTFTGCSASAEIW